MRRVGPGTASDMSDDPQEVAEALDEEVVDVVDDRTGDEFGKEDVSGGADRGVGQLVDDHATSEDHEAELIGESQPGPDLGPEERAMHAEED